jgi:hypothetical protein
LIFCSSDKFDFREISPRKREIERKTDRQINIQVCSPDKFDFWEYHQEREIERERDRQTERERDRDKQTDK